MSDYMKEYLEAWKWYQYTFEEFKKRVPGYRTNEQETLDFIIQHLAHLSAEIKILQQEVGRKAQNEAYREIDSLKDQESPPNHHPNE